jgi:hypothetical protein
MTVTKAPGKTNSNMVSLRKSRNSGSICLDCEDRWSFTLNCNKKDQDGGFREYHITLRWSNNGNINFLSAKIEYHTPTGTISVKPDPGKEADPISLIKKHHAKIVAVREGEMQLTSSSAKIPSDIRIRNNGIMVAGTFLRFKRHNGIGVSVETQT